MISFKHSSRHSAAPDITPLLDVVFILLIFFVISAVFTARGMDMELPDAETAHPVSGKSLAIELRSDGSLSCDGNPATMRDLSFILDRAAVLAPASQPGRILLKASPDAEVAPFVEIVDMVRKHGFNNLVVGTRANTSPPGLDGDMR